MPLNYRYEGFPLDSFETSRSYERISLIIERLWKAKIPFSWVVVDTVYGGNGDLRNWLEAHQYFYGLAVACTEAVGIHTPEDLKRMTVAEALSFHAKDWQRISMSDGTKGPRQFDWAMMPMLHRWEEDGRHFLLVCRCLDDPNEKTYYFVYAPLGTTLAEMVKAIGARWKIEIVQPQMTKTDLLVLRGSGDHVADLHLLVGNDDTINQQLD